MPDLGTERPLHGRSGPGADLVGQEAALAGGHAGVGLGRAIMALGGVGQLGCEGGGLGRAGVVMLVRGRGEAQVGIFGLFGPRCSPGRSRWGGGGEGSGTPLRGAFWRVADSC